MKREIPKRITIIGLPGSEKSTFADKQGKLLLYLLRKQKRKEIIESFL